ncbi:MAG: hypothetical protein OEM95_10680 [Gammaproteobacteria bacterium]|nr:hypothetical protein [Gammaproteobacteria bacterium]
MNMNPFATIVTAVAIASFTHSLAAQEKPEVNQADINPPAVVSEQEIINIEPVPLETTAPTQVFVQTEEKFLSEMKVYPAF